MGSSSKAKSSKKKSSKIHSQPRKMKKVKKSSRSKSKKVTRRRYMGSDDSKSSQSISSASNDSHSLYSHSDSMSSVSLSSSSSEGTCRGRKKVSRLRSNLKSTRKRFRRRLSSSESTEEFSRKKKRKRSRKNADSKSRKKSQKNKTRRYVSSSFATSDSYGSFTCREESGRLREESEVPKLRFKSRENKKHKRESREERVGTKKRTHRSPSCSSYSRSRDQIYSVSRGDENCVGEGKSRHLRSVITFAEQAHEKEGYKSEKDSLKEEIIYDHDDYPSPRSNGSSGGGTKRDVTFHSPVTSGDKRQKENVEGEETCMPNHRATEATESRKNADGRNVHDPFLNEAETNKYEKESRTYGSILGANLGADDLEAILRQKALENLRKFRGGIRRNVKATANWKNKDDGDANQSFSSNAEIVQRVLPKQDNTNVIDHVQMLDKSTTTTSVGEVSCPNKDIGDGGNSSMESGIAKQKAIQPPDGLALSGNPLKENNMTMQAVVVKSESRNSFFGEKTSGMNSSLNQAMVLQSSPDKKLTEKMESERKIPSRTTHSITPSITNNNEADVNNASSEQSTSRGQGSTEQQTKTKDGSQYEQKTMSVMRGGEMVQVNYKVYIPKRAPALARRQLKR